MMSKVAVEPGRLDKRIVIQKQTVIIDTEGNQIQEWRDFHSCHAAVNGVSGREYWQARQQHEENVTTFKVRYCTVLRELNTVDYRIVFNGRVYNIEHIDNVFFAGSILNIKGVETV